MEQNTEINFKTKKGAIMKATFVKMYTFRSKEYYLCKVNGKSQLISERQIIKEN